MLNIMKDKKSEKSERIFIRFEAIFRPYGLPDFRSFTEGKNKKGEGRFSFTFLRREISPAKDEQHSCYIYLIVR